MPMWQIHGPADAFGTDDKQALATRITDLYADFLPRFYVNVLFHAVEAQAFYVGGEPAGDFVRITVDHIARALDDPASQRAFVDRCLPVLGPFLTDRGLRWEMHVDNTPFDFWTINGLRPPPADTPAERQWRDDNRPSPWEGA